MNGNIFKSIFFKTLHRFDICRKNEGQNYEECSKAKLQTTTAHSAHCTSQTHFLQPRPNSSPTWPTFHLHLLTQTKAQDNGPIFFFLFFSCFQPTCMLFYPPFISLYFLHSLAFSSCTHHFPPFQPSPITPFAHLIPFSSPMQITMLLQTAILHQSAHHAAHALSLLAATLQDATNTPPFGYKSP